MGTIAGDDDIWRSPDEGCHPTEERAKCNRHQEIGRRLPSLPGSPDSNRHHQGKCPDIIHKSGEDGDDPGEREDLPHLPIPNPCNPPGQDINKTGILKSLAEDQNSCNGDHRRMAKPKKGIHRVNNARYGDDQKCYQGDDVVTDLACCKEDKRKDEGSKDNCHIKHR